ncbi:MAG: arsenate reductase (glutaredoxin) [Planctomycetes bacterium]|nr:arsenate reductase (glutaredoxin) [Planctomycetota bacterium]
MTAPTQLWFNPRCSKARATKALLEDRHEPIQLIDYQATPPTRTQLDTLMQQLGIDDPREMMRPKEAAYAELHLADATREALLDAITTHPILLERPIVVRGDRAVIARPPEKLAELFES